jgi:ketosteroid isomerase-like protein
MTIAENKRFVIETWQAFGSRDAARIASRFKPDAVWVAPHNNATAMALNAGSGLTGAEAIARFIAEDFPNMFRAARTEFRGIYGDGDVVIVETRLLATLSSGREYDNDYCFILELEDGRIKLMREYMDTAKGFRMMFGEECGAKLVEAGAS